MPSIHIFSSVDEAIKILGKYNRNITKEAATKEEVVKTSVSFNIFRAFRNLDKKPSGIYRSWASDNIDKIIFKLDKITTKRKYDEELFTWIYSFIEYWESQVPPENRIIFGPASKMVNLLIKTLNESTLISNKRIMSFMHIPFDEYTLKPLTKIINQMTSVKYRIDIPNNPTMKFISTPELYWIMQNALLKLCRKSNIHPILYDYWCWNEKH
jgi:hypothetical protein